MSEYRHNRGDKTEYDDDVNFIPEACSSSWDESEESNRDFA